MPLTRISPCPIGSSPLTVLIRVDFPEPDGPQTTTTSPRATRVVQSVSTRCSPYHFDTFRNSIMFRPLGAPSRQRVAYAAAPAVAELIKRRAHRHREAARNSTGTERERAFAERAKRGVNTQHRARHAVAQVRHQCHAVAVATERVMHAIA